MAEEPKPQRHNLYLDVDDDITSIINKLGEAKKSEVALVVPKRSNVLNSAVNLKLIKKAATAADKKPVLVTDDAAISRLAGGLHMLVAPNVKAEAAVPSVERVGSGELPSDTIEGEAVGEATAAAEAGQAVYQPPTSKATETKADKPKSDAADKPTEKGGKKSKIPDFNRFKKKLLIGAGIFVGLVLLVLALFFWLPKATIAINGNTKDLDADFKFTLDSNAKNSDLEQALLPGKRPEINKTLSSNFTPTGKKDLGTKANGSITIKNCQSSSPPAQSAGARFTSSNGKVFVATSAVSVPPATVNGGITCGTSDPIPVTAAENGDSYNIGSTTYSNPAYSGNYTITGTQMSGGSSKIASVTTQSDIDNAKAQLLEKERTAARKELEDKFDNEDFVIKESFKEEVKEISAEPKLDQEGSQGKLTLKVTYSEFGTARKDLDELIKKQAAKQAKASNNNQQLGVVDTGLDKATFAPLAVSGSAQDFQFKGRVLLGPDINFDELKSRVGGKNFSDTVEIVKSYPNVSSVDVKFSPFYVRKVPTNPKRIIIKIEIPRP